MQSAPGSGGWASRGSGLLLVQAVERRRAVAFLRARDALASGGFTLAPADAPLIVGIEATALVAAGGFELQLGRLVRVFDLELGHRQFLQGSRGGQLGELAGAHLPIPDRDA